MELARAGMQELFALAVTRSIGSMPSIYVHACVFGAWILLNLGVGPMEPWDPSLVMLAKIASVEAILSSILVLVSQNRLAMETAKRAELDLQANLLTEHEVTRLITIVSSIARHLDVRTDADAEVPELERDIWPEKIIDEIERGRAPDHL